MPILHYITFKCSSFELLPKQKNAVLLKVYFGNFSMNIYFLLENSSMKALGLSAQCGVWSVDFGLLPIHGMTNEVNGSIFCE